VTWTGRVQRRISYNVVSPMRGRPGRQHRLAAHGTAKVAELADALDLGSSGETRESSSLSFRTRSLAKSMT
jgi:hypothetical protein